MSSKKRKHVVCTIQQKMDILNQLENGVKAVKLAKQYGIGSSTIADIKKNRDKLYDYVNSSPSSLFDTQQRCRMRKSPYDLLNRALLQWFISERSQGRNLTGPMCVKKAKQLHKMLGLQRSFDGSNGWFSRFKERYGIRSIGSSLECFLANPIGCQEVLESNNENSEEYETNSRLGDIDYVSSIKHENELLTEGETQNLAQYEEIHLLTEAMTDEGSYNSNEPQESNQVTDLGDISTFMTITDEDGEICECSSLKHVIKKLETVTDKLVSTTFCDSYDQFGKYISTLLQRLPLEKAHSLKQKLVSDVLDEVLAYERAPPEVSLSDINQSLTKQNESLESLLSDQKTPHFPLNYSVQTKPFKLRIKSKSVREKVCDRIGVCKPTTSEINVPQFNSPENISTVGEQLLSGSESSSLGTINLTNSKKRKRKKSKSSVIGTKSISDSDKRLDIPNEKEKDLSTHLDQNSTETSGTVLFEEKHDPVWACDLCSVVCDSNQFLMLHYRTSHSECDPSTNNQSEEKTARKKQEKIYLQNLDGNDAKV